MNKETQNYSDVALGLVEQQSESRPDYQVRAFRVHQKKELVVAFNRAKGEAFVWEILFLDNCKKGGLYKILEKGPVRAFFAGRSLHHED